MRKETKEPVQLEKTNDKSIDESSTMAVAVAVHGICNKDAVGVSKFETETPRNGFRDDSRHREWPLCSLVTESFHTGFFQAASRPSKCP